MTIKEQVNKLENYCIHSVYVTKEDLKNVKNNIEDLLSKMDPSEEKSRWERRYRIAYDICLEKVNKIAS